MQTPLLIAEGAAARLIAAADRGEEKEVREGWKEDGIFTRGVPASQETIFFAFLLPVKIEETRFPIFFLREASASSGASVQAWMSDAA